jgi:uroporphyrinogen-III decarboxylase
MNIDHTHIEHLKQERRKLWDYQRVDHIPVVIWPTWTFGHPLREQLEQGEVQFEVNVKIVEKALRLIPDDYIPFARITPGYMTIATMFGMEVHWSSDPSQPPGAKGHMISDMKEVYGLQRPSLAAGLMPECLRRLRHHAAHLPSDVYLTGIDAGGPLNTCKDLLGTNLLYTAFYEDPQAFHYLLNMATDVQLEMYRAIVDAAGGINRMTSIDFDAVWAPEKHKSFVSDDVCSTIGPALFEEFSRPYNNRLYQPWGSGLLHNCGPHPSKSAYLAHEPRLKGLSLAYKYSQQEFPNLREIFAGWGILHVLLDNESTPEAMLAAFRRMAETLAPDVVGIPVCYVDDTWQGADVTDLYWQMRKVSDEYAANMRWLS